MGQSYFKYFRNRLILILNVLSTYLKELEYFKNILYVKLDDWIVYGLKNENDVINECIDSIKKSINNQKSCYIKNFNLKI